MRFLKAIRRSYYNSHKEGLIGPQALRHLLHSVSECVALDLPSSMEWELLEKRVLQPPDFRRFGLKSIAELINDSSSRFVSRIGKTMLYRVLRDQTDVAYGFAVSRNEVAELLPMVSKNPVIVQRLRQDCIAGRRESSQFLKSMVTQYGVIVRAVQTSSAARQILYTQRNEIHRLVEEGVLDEDDECRFLETVETSIKKVLAYYPRMLPPDPEVVLAEIPWLGSSKPEAIAAVTAIAEQFEAKRGVMISCGDVPLAVPTHKIQVEGDSASSDEIYIVVLTEGLVEILSRDNFVESTGAQPDPSRERAQMMSTRQSHVSTLGPGTVLGETSVLTGKPELVVVRSVSDQTTFARIALSKLKPVLNNFPEVEEALLHAGAVKIAREVMQFAEPFKHWPRSVLSLWLEEGQVSKYDSQMNSITLAYATVLIAGEAEREDLIHSEKIVGPEVLLTGPPEPGREPTFRLSPGSRLLTLKATSGMEAMNSTKTVKQQEKASSAVAQHQSLVQELLDLSMPSDVTPAASSSAPAHPEATSEATLSHDHGIETGRKLDFLGQDKASHGQDYHDDHEAELTPAARRARVVTDAMRDVAIELCKACSYKDLARVKRLVGEGVPVNCVDYDMRTPLHVAAAHGALTIVLFLLDERHANINPLDKRGHTPLNESILNHYEDVTNALVERGGRIGEGKSERHEVAVDMCVLARLGDVHDLRKMIDGGADVNKRDYEGRTALHIASSHNNFHVAELLIASGINVAIKDEFGHTALDDAIIAGSEDIAKLLRERGSPQTQTDASTLTLMRAAHTGNLRTVKSLIESGGLEASVKDLDQRTPLHIAASRGNVEIVKFLLEKNAYIEANDANNQTPLEGAVVNGHDDVCKILRTGGAQPVRPTPEVIDYFMRGVYSGDFALVKRVIENGLNPNQVDYKHRTGLHVAVAEGQTRVVEYLLGKGADPNVTDKHGESPLSVSMQDTSHTIIQLLLNHGARHGNSRGQALVQQAHLMEAACHGDVDVVKHLLEGGLDPNMVGQDRRTALHLACAEGHFQVCMLLIDKGADVNAADRWNATPLSDAYQNGHYNLVELLVEHGAVANSADDSVMHGDAAYGDSSGHTGKTTTGLLQKIRHQQQLHTRASRRSRSIVRPSGSQAPKTNPDLLL